MQARKIEVVAYNANWPEMFAHEQRQLKWLLSDIALNIEHIGSTSVIGLAAKPIIDILVEVTDLTKLDLLTDSMASLGYCARGEYGITGRRYFIKGGNKRTHHLHAFAQGDLQLEAHRKFKQYLLTNPDSAREYANIKRQAAQQCKNNAMQYSKLKCYFIERTMMLIMDN